MMMVIMLVIIIMIISMMVKLRLIASIMICEKAKISCIMLICDWQSES